VDLNLHFIHTFTKQHVVWIFVSLEDALMANVFHQLNVPFGFTLLETQIVGPNGMDNGIQDDLNLIVFMPH
jgi:hypothetical protein